MKKLIFVVLCSFGGCVASVPEPPRSSCVVYYTAGTIPVCNGILSVTESKEWCESAHTNFGCTDFSECADSNFKGLNKVYSDGTTCKTKGYAHGCGNGVFSTDKTNCP